MLVSSAKFSLVWSSILKRARMRSLSYIFWNATLTNPGKSSEVTIMRVSVSSAL